MFNYAKIKSKYWWIIIVLSISYTTLFANNIIELKDNMFKIDHKSKIIVVNQQINSVNRLIEDASYPILILDTLYTCGIEVNKFDIGVRYPVLSPDSSTYSLFFTTLPLVSITCEHIIDDISTVPITFELIENSGIYSKLFANILYRGGSTLNLPKKSFRLHFVKDTIAYEKKNVRLLNLRKDDDWNLQAMANEPLKLRGKVNNTIWPIIHRLSYHGVEPEAKSYVDMEYAELFVNGEYRGLYALSERIDQKQLKLSETAGGELFKAEDRAEGTMFNGTPEFCNTNPAWSGFFCKYPDSNWNWTFLRDAIDFVNNSDNQTFYRNYDKVFEIDNSVDYLIFINLLAAIDNTHKNIYYARYDSLSPLIIVPWDLDCSLGLSWDGTLRDKINDLVFTKYLVRLIFDFGIGGYAERIQKRWKELRVNTITSDVIMNLYRDSYNKLLSEGVYQREAIAWSDYHFDPNHIDYIAGWLNRRLAFLDGFFNNPKAYLVGETDVSEGIDASDLELRIDNEANKLEIISAYDSKCLEIKIYNYLGELALSKTLLSGIETLDISELKSDVYLVLINNNKSIYTRKIIINR